MNCRQCKKDLAPENPEVGWTLRGIYLKALCHGCPSSINGKAVFSNTELRLDALEEREPVWTKNQWGTVEQLKGQVLYLQGQVKELRAKKIRGDKL